LNFLIECKKAFFFEKKEAKNFWYFRYTGGKARLKKQKFFGSFFQKRTLFSGQTLIPHAHKNPHR
jgi:hypothetical protein